MVLESLFVGLVVLHKDTLNAINGIFEEITRGSLPEDKFTESIHFVTETPVEISEEERVQSIRLILRLCVQLQKAIAKLNETFGEILLLGMVFCRMEIINSLYLTVKKIVFQQSCLVEMLIFLELSARVLVLIVASEAVLDEVSAVTLAKKIYVLGARYI